MRTLLAALLVPLAALAAPLTTSADAADAAPAAGGKAPTLKLSDTSVTAGATFTATGTFRKKYAGRKVALQVASGATWKTVGSHKATAKGAYAITATAPDDTGTIRLRAYAAAGKAKAASAVHVLKVTAAPAETHGTTQWFTNGSWSFSFGATDTDAWPELQAADPDNVAPEAGWSYVLVPVTFRNDSDEADEPYWPNDIELVGSDGEYYSDTTDDDQDCGTVPDDWADADELDPGATVTANVCAVVPTSALAGGKWSVLNDDADDETLVALS